MRIFRESCFLVIIAIVISAIAIGCQPKEEPNLPNCLSVVSKSLQVGHYRHYLLVVRDSETETEYIVVSSREGTAICPVSR
jgi:hypothetical protein